MSLVFAWIMLLGGIAFTVKLFMVAPIFGFIFLGMIAIAAIVQWLRLQVFVGVEL